MSGGVVLAPEVQRQLRSEQRYHFARRGLLQRWAADDIAAALLAAGYDNTP